MSTKGKIWTYKSCVRPILTYAAETRAETAKPKQILATNEMKTLRTIKEVTLKGHVKSNNIRGNVEDVVRWIRTRKRNWRAHVDRMGDERCKLSKTPKAYCQQASLINGINHD